MKTNFQKLSEGFSLTEKESYQLINSIINKQLNPTQTAATLAFYLNRPIQLQELNGFKSALLDNCLPVTLHKDCIDVCGTGGDGKDTFNISTISALVLAASGVPVAKHGNYGSTSISGSSDILNYLGYKFITNEIEINEELYKHNFCFMHAPLFHPALKNVSTYRKELGVRTFFNLLGPLVNPSTIVAKFVGVFNQDTARLYNYYLQKTDLRYSIVHSTDGYDEVSLTSSFKLYTNTTEKLITPEEIGFSTINAKELMAGTTIKEAAKLFTNVLKNECTKAQKDVILANSALAYCCYDPGISFEEAREKCRETIESKKAYELLKQITYN